MPRPKRNNHVSPPQGGRPLIHINWSEVDYYLKAGCNGTQIAAHFNMNRETLYDRVQLEMGVGFSEYKRLKWEAGNSQLLGTQYKMALEKDKTMLVWLGKQRLGQRDDPKRDDEFSAELKGFVDYLKKKYGEEELAELEDE